MGVWEWEPGSLEGILAVGTQRSWSEGTLVGSEAGGATTVLQEHGGRLGRRLEEWKSGRWTVEDDVERTNWISTWAGKHKERENTAKSGQLSGESERVEE